MYYILKSEGFSPWMHVCNNNMRFDELFSGKMSCTCWIQVGINLSQDSGNFSDCFGILSDDESHVNFLSVFLKQSCVETETLIVFIWDYFCFLLVLQ